MQINTVFASQIKLKNPKEKKPPYPIKGKKQKEQ
jgi:hypothetical protein